MKSEPKAFASLSSGLLARKGSARPAMRPQGFGQSGGSLDDLGWNDMGYEAPRPALTPIMGGGHEQFGEEHVEPQLSRTPLAGLTPISPVHHQQAEIAERLVHSAEEDESAEYDEYAEESHFGDDFGEEEPLELEDSLPEAMPSLAAMSQPAPAAVVPLYPAEEEQADEAPAFEAAPVAAPTPAPPARRTPKRSRSTRADTSGKGKAAFTLRLDPSRHLKLRLACAVNAKSAQQLVTKALDELLSSMPELDAMASQAPERASRKG